MSVTLCLACAGLPGLAAAGSFSPPKGCAAFMTVQLHGCVVEHHYRCDDDAPGDQWTTLYDSDGPFFTTHVDGEFQWLESYEHDPPLPAWLETPSPDPASFSNLLSTGEDTYDFTTRDAQSTRLRYHGLDRLTGERVVIDGIPLEVTAFEVTESHADGTVRSRRWGNQYVHRDWRLFFSGAETTEFSGQTLPSDSTPVDFIFPGEPGYLSTVPLFDCDALMSRAEKPLMEDIRDDRL